MLKGLTGKLDISKLKRNCRICQNVAPGCKKGTMSNWKTKSGPGGRKTKCPDCASRHSLEREAAEAVAKLEAHHANTMDHG